MHYLTKWYKKLVVLYFLGIHNWVQNKEKGIDSHALRIFNNIGVISRIIQRFEKIKVLIDIDQSPV